VEYIGVARLVILGVASRTPFNYDEVEDLRLAVGEACTSAIDRANNTGTDGDITITCQMDDDRVEINVTDNVPSGSNGSAPPAGAAAIESSEDQNFGPLLMEILVDEIHQEVKPGAGTSITMTKYIGR
jgi:serine/threonine-protein kinase RsbW